jgi:alpha-acetolactate decarboxylase
MPASDPGPSVQPPDKTKVFRLLVEISVAMSPCKTSPYAIIIPHPADTATRRDYTSMTRVVKKRINRFSDAKSLKKNDKGQLGPRS